MKQISFKMVMALLVITTSLLAKEPFKVVGYYNQWALPSEEEIAQLDFTGLTHLIVSPIRSTPEGEITFFCYEADTAEVVEMFQRVGEKAKAAGAKPLLSLVDWTMDSFTMTRNKESRTTFINNILKLCNDWGFSGIDLDLEGTAEEFNWGSPGTFYPEKYELLAKELRVAMDDTLTLSAAVEPNRKKYSQWSDGFLEQLDFINVMTYNIRLGWAASDVDNHSTYADHLEAAALWRDRMEKPSQIVLGMPFYARGWDLDNNLPYKEEASTGVTAEFGYKEFVKRYNLTPGQDSFHIAALETVAKGSKEVESCNGSAAIFFNGRDMIERKTRWTKDSSDYGGVMMLSVDGDLPRSDTMSLTRAIMAVIEEETALSQPTAVRKSAITIQSLSQGSLTLSTLEEGVYSIALHNAKGQRVYKLNKQQLSAGINTISLGDISLSKGVYFCSVISEIENSTTHLKLFY